MTTTKMAERWRGILSSYTEGGLDAIHPVDTRELASLYVQEVRKGAFDPLADTPQALIPRFMEHFRREFAEDANAAQAWNYQRNLLRSARRAQREPHPIEAVILYATFAEHWVN